MTALAYETDNYIIKVGKGPDDVIVYQVVNKETNVVEYDDMILPRTLDAIVNLQGKMVEELAKFHDFINPTEGDIEEDGANSLH